MSNLTNNALAEITFSGFGLFFSQNAKVLKTGLIQCIYNPKTLLHKLPNKKQNNIFNLYYVLLSVSRWIYVYI